MANNWKNGGAIPTAHIKVPVKLEKDGKTYSRRFTWIGIHATLKKMTDNGFTVVEIGGEK